jgi:hypothetical protein
LIQCTDELHRRAYAGEFSAVNATGSPRRPAAAMNMSAKPGFGGIVGGYLAPPRLAFPF